MMYICKPMPKEATVNTDNNDLATKLQEADQTIALLERRVQQLQDKWSNDTNVLGNVLYTCLTSSGDQETLLDAIKECPYDNAQEIIEYHEAAPEGWLTRDYEVTVTFPVSVTLVVTAGSVDEAEEAAKIDIEHNGLDYYNMDYDLYDVYCEVAEA